MLMQTQRNGHTKQNNDNICVIFIDHSYACMVFLNRLNVRFEVLTAVTMKITVVCNVTSCILLDIYNHFGGTFCLDLEGRK
jgi:hypothetical protein